MRGKAGVGFCARDVMMDGGLVDDGVVGRVVSASEGGWDVRGVLLSDGAGVAFGVASDSGAVRGRAGTMRIFRRCRGGNGPGAEYHGIYPVLAKYLIEQRR